MSRKSFYVSLLLTVIISFGLCFAGAQKSDDALSKLVDGNKRFVSGNLQLKDLSGERRKELSKGQHPSAIVVACSDSRVPPEIIFDQGLGDVFVIRVAGNVLDPVSVGSIDYAAEHLHAPLIIVLGHDNCGAVKAALEAKEKTADNIGAVIRKILPAVKKATERGGSKEDILNNAIRENVMVQQKYLLRKSAIVRNLIASGNLKIVTGIYHIESGEIELFDK